MYELNSAAVFCSMRCDTGDQVIRSDGTASTLQDADGRIDFEEFTAMMQ
jgi:hypothetical protein